MNNKYKLFAILICLLATNHLWGDNDLPDYDIDSIPRYLGQEVVIESFKQNRGLYLEPISASLLTAKELERKQVTSIKELSASIPNFYMPDYGSKYTSPVYVRGIGSRVNAPSVALYVDGIPYFDRASFDINLKDVESMEFLRGPQGTIYGRNTMGGVINIFTKSPFQYQGTNINLSAGSHNRYDVGASHYNKLNEKLAFSLSANYGHGGGYYKNYHTNKKVDPIDEVSTRARLSWRVNPRLNMDFIFAYEYSDQNGYPYRLYDIDTKEASKIAYDTPSFYKRNLSSNGLHLNYVTDQFKLSSQTSFQYTDGNQGVDQDFTPKKLVFVDFGHRERMYSEEVNIKSIKPDNWYDWQFGVFGFYHNQHQNNDVQNFQANQRTTLSSKSPTYGFAVYHQSTVNNLLVKNLSFIFGIRYDWEKTKLEYSNNNETPAHIKADFSQVTPKFALNYKFKDNGLTYFSVTRGYKTGGFNNTALIEEERSFDPEYSWSYELGAKSSFFNNLLHLDLSLFFIDWRDQQISQRKTVIDATTQKMGNILRNAGKSQSKGLEFTADINPSKNLNLTFSYGYTHAKYKDYNDGNKDESKRVYYDGNFIPMVPRHTLALSASYTIDVNQKWLDSVILSAQWRGLGRIYWNDINTVSQPFYMLLDEKISFRKKDLSLSFWMKNLTDERYISYHFLAFSSNYVQYGKPLTWGFDLNYSF